jgi:hypothetical protein
MELALCDAAKSATAALYVVPPGSGTVPDPKYAVML